MVSFDQEVVNPAIRLKGGKAIEMPKGGQFEVTSTSTLTSLKWGE
jgi:hypothetical protein